MPTTETRPAAPDEARRTRATRLLFAGAAIGASGHTVVVAVAPLAAEDLTGGVALAGIPGAVAIVGTALGASAVATLMQRANRRIGLSTGYATSLVGAGIGFAALLVGSFSLLLVGSALFGVGNATNQMTRYVVAELHEPDRRGQALGWIVWAGTIGGVIGPNLLAPTGRWATWAGLPELSGPYLVAGLVMVLVALGYQALLRPDPSTFAVAGHLPMPEDQASTSPAASPWRLPVVRVAVAVMVTGQVVMVWLMSMTPVHIRESGGDLGRVGLILSAHIFGMYALAPLAGWVEDRFGSLVAIATALATLALSAVLAAIAPVGGLFMGVALLLLGLGWSFGFVAGSTMLARDVPEDVRPTVQGRVETGVWLASAVASLAAGLLLEVLGFVGLAVVAIVVLALPVTFVVRQRRRLSLFGRA